MARGRLISKSLSTSAARARLHDVAGKLAEFCQALYPLLVAHADDFGRLAGDPFTIKHMVDPTSPRRLTDFALALRALDEAGLINWYQVASVDIIQILKFDEHQPGLHKRSKSKFPEKQDKGQSQTAPQTEATELPGISRGFPEIPSELNRTEQNRRESEGAPRPPAPVDLLDAWNAGTTAPIPKSKELSD